MKLSLTVNGRRRDVDVEPDTPTLYVLRNDLELNGPKFGCGLAQCGSCTVLVDGEATRCCVVPVRAVAGKEITTLEGLGTRDNPHPLQTAFIHEQAMQCGYCVNGVIMTAAAFLREKPDASREEIREALAETLCRCGAQHRMLRAIERAQKEMSG
jgi:nicotinate dehydrogenase subunit A